MDTKHGDRVERRELSKQSLPDHGNHRRRHHDLRKILQAGLADLTSGNAEFNQRAHPGHSSRHDFAIVEIRDRGKAWPFRDHHYIEHISRSAIGHEIAQLAHEDDPLNVIRALEKEDWLKVLHPHWSSAKVDTNGLSALMKTRQQMVDLGYTVDPSAAVMHFLTAKLSDKDVSDLQRLIPRKDLIASWRDIETHAKELAKRLTGKEAATPSRTWNLLSSARPEMILFLAVTSRQQAVEQKIKNFLTKWRQVQQRIPLPEMTELLITPALPEYPKIARDVFMLLLDGKLRSRTETLKFLKPFAPPPPPPPPPPRRGRGAKAAAAAGSAVAAVPGKKGELAKGKGKAAVAATPAVPAADVAVKVKAAPAKVAVPAAKHGSKPALKRSPAPAKKAVAKKAIAKKAKRR